MSAPHIGKYLGTIKKKQCLSGVEMLNVETKCTKKKKIKKHSHTHIHVAYKHSHAYTQNTAKKVTIIILIMQRVSTKDHTKHSVTQLKKKNKLQFLMRCLAKT